MIPWYGPLIRNPSKPLHNSGPYFKSLSTRGPLLWLKEELEDEGSSHGVGGCRGALLLPCAVTNGVGCHGWGSTKYPFTWFPSAGSCSGIRAAEVAHVGAALQRAKASRRPQEQPVVLGTSGDKPRPLLRHRGRRRCLWNRCEFLCQGQPMACIYSALASAVANRRACDFCSFC